MKYSSLKNSLLFSLFFLLGTLSVFQFKAVQNTNVDLNTNPFRDIRIALEENEKLKTEVNTLKNTLQTIQTQDQIQEYALSRIEKAEEDAGIKKHFEYITLFTENNLTANTATELIHTLFGAGAQNIEINGFSFKYDQNGFDDIPQGLLFGGNILSAPFQIHVYGPENILIKTLHPESGVFNSFTQKGISFLLSSPKE
jgi:uncharacterized protein YlxW (UPF0749 family)